VRAAGPQSTAPAIGAAFVHSGTHGAPFWYISAIISQVSHKAASRHCFGTGSAHPLGRTVSLPARRPEPASSLAGQAPAYALRQPGSARPARPGSARPARPSPARPGPAPHVQPGPARLRTSSLAQPGPARSRTSSPARPGPVPHVQPGRNAPLSQPRPSRLRPARPPGGALRLNSSPAQ